LVFSQRQGISMETLCLDRTTVTNKSAPHNHSLRDPFSFETAERNIIPIAEEVRKAGQEIAASSFLLFANKSNAVSEQFVGWSCEAASAALIDADGNKTATFSSIILAGDRAGITADGLIPADSAGAVFHGHVSRP